MADVNGDGNPDLLVTGEFAALTSVYQGNGRGGFGNPAKVPVGAEPLSLMMADVDGDGDLDAVVSNAGNNSVSVRLNGTTGPLLPTAVRPTETAATRLVAWPNPARGTLQLAHAPAGQPVLLLDLQGRTVRRYAAAAALDVFNVAPGLYLLRCGTQATRVVVE